jgi:hypothetical protein
MLERPSAALMVALRAFVFRHEIFVEAREFDDGLIFSRQPRGRPRKGGSRRHFRVFLRRDRRRVHFFTLSCGSEELARLQVPIDFPEKVLLRPAEAAIEYEACGRDATRYSAPFSKDAEAGRALFGYVRSESRLLLRLVGDAAYKELLGLVRRHARRSRRRRRGVAQELRRRS